jgi:hypothetical protein
VVRSRPEQGFGVVSWFGSSWLCAFACRELFPSSTIILVDSVDETRPLHVLTTASVPRSVDPATLCTATPLAFCHADTRPTHSGLPRCTVGCRRDTLGGSGGRPMDIRHLFATAASYARRGASGKGFCLTSTFSRRTVMRILRQPPVFEDFMAMWYCPSQCVRAG